MGTVERFLLGLTGVALATTLVLPGRQTVPLAEKVFTGTAGLFRAATGQPR